MHASKVLWDAFMYAPGPILCRVKVEGEIVREYDKLAGRYRTILEMVDFTPYLKLILDEFIERIDRMDKEKSRDILDGTYFDAYRKGVKPFLRGEAKTFSIRNLPGRGVLWSLSLGLKSKKPLLSLVRDTLRTYEDPRDKDHEWLCRRFLHYAKKAGLI